MAKITGNLFLPGMAMGRSLPGAKHRGVLARRTCGISRYNAVTALHANDWTRACELEKDM